MELSDDYLDLVISEIKDYQLINGSLLKLVGYEEPTSVPARAVNVSVVPTVFPQRLFDQAITLQLQYNDLYVKQASDERWLFHVLKPILKHDHFLQILWEIYTTVDNSGIVQNLCCGIFRSDYMIHQSDSSHSMLKQVEMNTFSVAGAVHAERIAKMHLHLKRVHGQDMKLATSNNLSSIVATLKRAHELYKSQTERPSCILMIVQPVNFNVADERPIEYRLRNDNIPCYRCDWPLVLSQTTLTSDRTLLFHPSIGPPELEVSVIYYRAGYDAHEYDEKGKECRLRLELSRSIKCPDVLTHLTTFKAVQVALAQPASTAESIDIPAPIRDTFMPMHPLAAHDGPLTPDVAKDYVLKPNLEGGGNNIYRSNIPAFLATLPEHERAKYSLMRMIEPPEKHGVLMTPNDLYRGPVMSELGVLGTCIWRRTKAETTSAGGRAVTTVEMLSNEVAGWTFKTKPAAVEEMSVVKGYGCFDCPRLVDEVGREKSAEGDE